VSSLRRAERALAARRPPEAIDQREMEANFAAIVAKVAA